jgi:hypothetical protein
LSPNHTVGGLAFGAGKFAMVGGENGRPFARNSTTGQTWQLVFADPLSGNLQNLAFSDGEFLACGRDGLVVTSSNGDNWSRRPTGRTYLLTDITKGNGRYVAVGRVGPFVSPAVIITSDTGSDWTDRIVPITDQFDQLISVAFGNNVFVANGTSGGLVTSPDGITWTKQTALVFGPIEFMNGEFVASAGRTSPDGVNWTQRVARGQIVYADGTYFAYNSGAIHSSPAASGPATGYFDQQHHRHRG